MLPKERISTHPGRILLREFLDPSGITQAKLARDLGLARQELNRLVRGRSAMTAKMAWGLSNYFHNSAEFWMQLQIAHELTVARLNRR